MKICPKCKAEHDKPGLYCSRKCANSHTRTKESKNKTSLKMKGYHFGGAIKKEKQIVTYKEQKEKISKKHTLIFLKVCPICNKEFEVSEYYKDKKIYCSRDCYCKDSEGKFRVLAPGGYRKGSGRGKSGWYKEYYCDSSYELAYVIYNLEHNIKFERNKKGFEYEFEGGKFKYYPDFILEDNTYIEIKGYKTKQLESKLATLTNIKVLYKEDLKEVFNYVESKYGKDFIKLYEGNPYNQFTNTCKVCGNVCKKKSIVCSRKCSGKLVNKLKPEITEETKFKIKNSLLKRNDPFI